MVEKFFFFSLEATARFFGYLGGVLSVIVIIVSESYLEYLQNLVELIKGNATQSSIHYLFVNRIQFGIILFFACISVVNHVTLAWGSIKKREKLLLPWLIASPVFAVLLFGRLLIVSIGTDDPYVLALAVMTLILQTYLWIAMKSLYAKFKTENESRPSPPLNCHTLK